MSGIFQPNSVPGGPQTISAQWTFSVDPFFSSASPGLNWIETDQAADEQRWRARVTGKTWQLLATTDNAATQRLIMRATRGVGPAITLIELGNTTDNAPVQLNGTGRLTSGGVIQTPGFTVATLPAGAAGDRAHVTDALAPTFGAAVAGGGAVTTPVFFNGGAWIVG